MFENSLSVLNKFYKTNENTKPQVKIVAEKIKQSGKLKNLESFIEKFGYPIWEKAILQQKNQTQIENSANSDSFYVLIPTVFSNAINVNGFIAVEEFNNGINFQTYLGTDYKKFHYESSNLPGVDAEFIAEIMLVLENETFGYKKFSITDNLLSLYKKQPNNDETLLELVPEQTTVAGRTRTCYYEQYWWVDGRGNWTELGPPVALFCWGNQDLGNITSLPDYGSGGGGGASAPPAYNNNYEVCKKNVDAVYNSLQVMVNSRKISDEMDGNNLLRNIRYEKDEIKGHFFMIHGNFSGKALRQTRQSPWYWDYFEINSSTMDGEAVFGKITSQVSSGSQTTYQNNRNKAVVDYKIQVTCEYTCFGLFNSYFPNKVKDYNLTFTAFAHE